MAWDDIPDWADTMTRILMQALKEKDPYTYGHCRRVGKYSRMLAQAAGLNEYEQRTLEYAGIFHDLGKIGIPDRILLKNTRLTEEEEEVMKEHPVKSVEILHPVAHLPFFGELMPGILHHHERMDGKGYPDHIQGNTIPLNARIITVVDTFDAMTTTRPYRKGKGFEFAYKELKTFAGRQFDPHLVEIFLKAHPTWGEMEQEITEEFIAARYRRVA